ncbi:MAG: hypothetical protein LIP09_05310 [Bacteroidales bacterium]|nr:hypothetical protein [Bacteroidales bacterium]
MKTYTYKSEPKVSAMLTDFCFFRLTLPSDPETKKLVEKSGNAAARITGLETFGLSFEEFVRGKNAMSFILSIRKEDCCELEEMHSRLHDGEAIEKLGPNDIIEIKQMIHTELLMGHFAGASKFFSMYRGKLLIGHPLWQTKYKTDNKLHALAISLSPNQSLETQSMTFTKILKDAGAEDPQSAEEDSIWIKKGPNGLIFNPSKKEGYTEYRIGYPETWERERNYIPYLVNQSYKEFEACQLSIINLFETEFFDWIKPYIKIEYEDRISDKQEDMEASKIIKDNEDEEISAVIKGKKFLIEELSTVSESMRLQIDQLRTIVKAYFQNVWGCTEAQDAPDFVIILAPSLKNEKRQAKLSKKLLSEEVNNRRHKHWYQLGIPAQGLTPDSLPKNKKSKNGNDAISKIDLDCLFCSGKGKMSKVEKSLEAMMHKIAQELKEKYIAWRLEIPEDERDSYHGCQLFYANKPSSKNKGKGPTVWDVATFTITQDGKVEAAMKTVKEYKNELTVWLDASNVSFDTRKYQNTRHAQEIVALLKDGNRIQIYEPSEYIRADYDKIESIMRYWGLDRIDPVAVYHALLEVCEDSELLVQIEALITSKELTTRSALANRFAKWKKAYVGNNKDEFNRAFKEAAKGILHVTLSAPIKNQSIPALGITECVLEPLMHIRLAQISDQDWCYAVGHIPENENSSIIWTKVPIRHVLSPDGLLSKKEIQDLVIRHLDDGGNRYGDYSRKPSIFKIMKEWLEIQQRIRDVEDKTSMNSL